MGEISEEGVDKLGLLNLPKKAVECLLECLNLWNVMNLRLVCKQTKAWVEDSETLNRFCVHVKERKFLKKLMKSTVKWSHLRIVCDEDDISGSWIKSQEYINTFSKLNKSLKILKLAGHRLSFNNGLKIILENCPNLETLELGTIDLSNLDFPVASKIPEDGKKILPWQVQPVLNWYPLLRLKSLGISYVAWENEKDLQFFSIILENSKMLEFFKLPYILSMRLYSLYPTLNENEIDEKLESICAEVLFKPIVDTLEKAGEHGQCRLKCLDVENYYLSQLLSNLLPVCKKSVCLLFNVMDDLEKVPTPDERILLRDTIGSLLNCTKFLCFDELEKLKSITISEDCSESSDIDKSHADSPLPALKSVILTLTKSVLVSERLASCLLQHRRESINEVSVKFEELSGSAQTSIFRPVKFASSIPQLRRLCLDGYKGKSSDYLLFWKSFPLLEDLSLLNCATLDDQSFGTENESSFLFLKYLKRLAIENGEATDVTLVNVLCQMALEVLILALDKVTFEGLSKLTTGPLIKSLMVFHCLNPDDYRDDFFKDYFKHFKNLKKHEILFLNLPLI